MPLNSSDYKIKIKTEADAAPVEETKAAFDQLSGAVKKSGDASGASAKDVEKLEISHRQLHFVLERVAPGLAELAHFMTSGLAGAIGIVLVAFNYLNQQLQDFKKFLDDVASGPGARGEWASKIADNTRAASVEMAAFNERLNDLVNTQAALAKSTDDLVTRQKAHADDARAVGDAQKQLDLARLALAEKLHQVSPDQAVVIRLEIDDAAFKRDLEAKKAEIQAELSTRQHEWDTNQANEPGLHAAMTRANSAFADADHAQAKNSGRLAQDKANLDAVQKAYDITQQKLEELSHISLSKLLPFDLMEKKALLGQQTQQENLMGSLRRSIGQEQGHETPLAQAAAVAKMQADKAKSDYEEAAKLSHDTYETIEKLKADLTAANARSTALQGIHDQTSQVQRAGVSADRANRIASGHGTPDDLEFQQFVADQQSRARQQGPQAGVDASRVITTAESILSHVAGAGGHQTPQQMQQVHEILNQILGYLNSNNGYVQQMDSQLGDLAMRLRSIESQQRVNRTSP